MLFAVQKRILARAEVLCVFKGGLSCLQERLLRCCGDGFFGAARSYWFGENQRNESLDFQSVLFERAVRYGWYFLIYD